MAIWTLPALGSGHPRLTGAQPGHLLTVVPHGSSGVTAAGWRAGERTRGSMAPEPGPVPAWCGSGRGLSSETRSTGTRRTGGSAWLGTDHCPSLTGAAAPAVSDDATEVPEAGLTAVTLEAPNTWAAGALTRGWVTGATVRAVWVAVAGTCKARAGCGHCGSVAPRSSGVGPGGRTHWGSQPGPHPGPLWHCPGSSRRESGCSVGGPRGAAGPRWGLQGEAEGSDGRHGHVSTVGLATAPQSPRPPSLSPLEATCHQDLRAWSSGHR